MTFRAKRFAVLGCFIAVAIGLAYLPAGDGFCNPQGFSDIPYTILNIAAFSVLQIIRSVFHVPLPEECPAILHAVAYTNLFMLAGLFFLVTLVRAIAGICLPASVKDIPLWLAFTIAFMAVLLGVLIVFALVWQ